MMLTSFASVLALAAGANAIALRGNTCTCTFHLTTSGDVSFPVGEDTEGEILGDAGSSPLCLNGDTIYDTQGRPCWFTPPTYVLQCDVGATPSTGFAIACDGTLSYNGQTTFYECPNGIGDEVNIYSKPDQGTKCGSITLTADGCRAACPTPTPTPSTGCPVELGSDYQFPHLIVPIDSSQPNTAAGTSYFGQVSSTISTIFNFDIPAAYSGKQCSLWFAFPTQAQLTTSSFTISGNGGVDFKSLSAVATQGTTYGNAPSASADLGQFTLAAGNAYKVASFACPAGTTVSYEASAVGDTQFRYFQDYNECPIGLYILPN